MGPRRLQNTLPRDLTLRPFAKGDGPATFDVFYQAVHTGTGDHYTPAQQAAWVPTAQMPEGWEAKHRATTAFIALQGTEIIGFMTLTRNGLIDMAFVRPNVMGVGVAAQLYEEIEAAAHRHGHRVLSVEASHLARPFFLRQGWSVVEARVVQRDGQNIENFHMEKVLGGC
ncbi:GNAT family acetyltransferase [Litoreibacter meonggei]|uniref:GNAT family acetyltransferase n=1 Tax=Litoreibacter meonggei TaxID=1049199 RepID=A0A497X5L5_9RHOB|nr:GNAT family N-acetyltransferase [Litoreibacter meonggei]RLJ60361.1 GNAT family acetyltransferase [Litoreibacter meonggei]